MSDITYNMTDRELSIEWHEYHKGNKSKKWYKEVCEAIDERKIGILRLAALYPRL